MKRLFRAGRVIVAIVDNAQGKHVMIGDGSEDYITNPVVVATTPGGLDAAIDALQDAKAALWAKEG